MSQSSLILTIDRNQRNLELLAQFLNQEGYQTLAASSLEDAKALLAKPYLFSLAMVDISAFDRSVWAVCETLREQGVPLLIIAPSQIPHIQEEGLVHGAQGVLIKPLVVKQLVAIIQSMIREFPSE